MASSTNNRSRCSPPPTSSTPFPSFKPSAAADLPQLQSLQSALLTVTMQRTLRTPAAWSLVVPLLAHTVVPLLAHEDANAQFFGVHTAHGKITPGHLAGLSLQELLALRDALVWFAANNSTHRTPHRPDFHTEQVLR
ncbi:hypothetical protein DFH06DRAFT_1325933 [Mycena polygramma]|nr:hypothetical protein DFH06DRAFT_1325933 [Mycena polygramma]